MECMLKDVFNTAGESFSSDETEKPQNAWDVTSIVNAWDVTSISWSLSSFKGRHIALGSNCGSDMSSDANMFVSILL